MATILTIKQMLLQAFTSQKRALTVDELSQLTGIPVIKIRRRLTPYEQEIVRVGNSLYDLAERVYKGKTFRYTPSKEEIKNGILRADDDLGSFLTAWDRHNAQITFIDVVQGNQYKLLHEVNAKKLIHFPYYANLTDWYKLTGFAEGDDLLVTCRDLRTHTFSIRKERKEERDALLIAVKNNKLADMVYDILNHSIYKYDSTFFIIRKYLYVYPYNEDTPPDHLMKALAKDKRFLLSSRDVLLSASGKSLTYWDTIGLRKYYFQNDQQEWTLVFIDEKKGRKFGYCSECGERLYWAEDYRWLHPQTPGQYARKYLDPSFFTFDKKKEQTN